MPRSIPCASSSLVQMTSLVPPNCWKLEAQGSTAGPELFREDEHTRVGDVN